MTDHGIRELAVFGRNILNLYTGEVRSKPCFCDLLQ